MKCFYIETKSTNPWYNLALEEHLSTRIRSGEVILYLWQNDRTVVIGRNQNALRECHAALLEEEGGYLARRKTGGGAVYQDLGNLCFTFLASPEVYDQEKQFRVVMEACACFGIRTCLSGRNDIITEDGYKFSGNAFSHTSSCSIHHGTLMVDVDVENMKRYLTPSKEKLKAKGVKSVQSRVCNLRFLSPEVTTDSLGEALEKSFSEIYGAGEENRIRVLKEDELDSGDIEERFRQYASWDWRYGKSPDCETRLRKRFDWGEVEAGFTLHQLCFQHVKIYSDALDVTLPGKLERYLTGKRCDRLSVQDTQLWQDEDQRRKAQQVIDWMEREALL